MQAIFNNQAAQRLFHCIGHDIFVQQLHILLHRHQAALGALIGINVFPTQPFPALPHFAAGIHAHRHLVGIRQQINPMDFKIQLPGQRLTAQLHRTGTVRQHPAQKILFKRNFRLGILQAKAVGFAAETLAAQYRRSRFRSRCHRFATFTGAHRAFGLLHRRHPRHTHASRAHHLAGWNLRQQPVHHHRMAGQNLVGIRRAAGKAADFVCTQALLQQTAHRQRGQLRVAVRGAAGFRVDGVIAGGDGIGAQNHLAHARRRIPRHAEHRFHFIVAHRQVGQKCSGAFDINI